jgi:ankyrin repeat protein
MKYFIEKLEIDPTWRDKYNQTTIFYTARNGLFRTTEYLIEKQVSIDDEDLNDQTPIFYAAR